MKLRINPDRRTIKDIFIVEDEAIIGMALAADLEDLGYRVIEVCCTGEEAIQQIKKKPADLILLDIQLRGALNGLETLERIRQFDSPKVIIISGNSEVSTYKKAQDMQVDGFIVKPINIGELQKIINALTPP